jgi:hypothetical protein
MITTTNELEWALDQIQKYEAMLDALRKRLADNPQLLAVTSKAYEQRLRVLHSDVVAFLRERPGEAPLHVAARGTEVGHGIIRAKAAALLLDGMRRAFSAMGSVYRQRNLLPHDVALREVFSLNLVATTSGSFVFSLDLAPRTQPSLFADYEWGERALEELAGYVSALRPGDEAAPDVPPSVLAGLGRLSEVLDQGVDEVEIEYRSASKAFSACMGRETREAILSRMGGGTLGPQTIKGELFEINTKTAKCRILTEGRTIICDYEESIEAALIRSLKHWVEIAGPTAGAGGRLRITRIESFRRITPPRHTDDDEDIDDQRSASAFPRAGACFRLWSRCGRASATGWGTGPSLCLGSTRRSRLSCPCLPHSQRDHTLSTEPS